ncbi:unnamed protein product [Rotaria sp. Silwood2]|nr:unnamed protein product [Rotaria sp. Silwood2]CAF3538317.1 unnamed protein product [Rotaria sp. Silwood2]CAF4543147.1 unnamed protein product [Rotaria sp. Silwood2]CAF4649653.1 unnamed protein product [Rotaria sp. Silwood2]CAF4783184.1 unnamed protein product [Rotaria sp. Silwood2]
MVAPADMLGNTVMIGLDDIYTAEDSPFYEQFLLNQHLLHSQHVLDYIANEKRKNELIGSNHDIPFGTDVMAPITQYFNMEWPEGEETWFIQDGLSQRHEFFTSEQEIVPINSTVNTVEDSLQGMHSSCEHVSSSIVQQSNEIILVLERSLPKQETSRQQNRLFNDDVAKTQGCTDSYSEFIPSDTIIIQLKSITAPSKSAFQSNICPLFSIVINFITFLFVSMVFGNIDFGLIFYNDKNTSQFHNNMVLSGINHFDWFRTLAVP